MKVTHPLLKKYPQRVVDGVGNATELLPTYSSHVALFEQQRKNNENWFNCDCCEIRLKHRQLKKMYWDAIGEVILSNGVEMKRSGGMMILICLFSKFQSKQCILIGKDLTIKPSRVRKDGPIFVSNPKAKNAREKKGIEVSKGVVS